MEMSRERRLTAIMFTDIVGYTAIMGENEERAVDLLERNRIIQKPLILKYGGIWLKEMGDGTLSSFNSVLDAVHCAIEIQELCQREADLNLRIGIHLGEVIFDKGDVFGDGVNIASRIEPLASPGGIVVTESVYQNLLNKQGIETRYVGEQRLKNVNLPIRIYDIKLPGVELPNWKKKSPINKWFYLLGVLIVLVLITGLIWYRTFNHQTVLEAGFGAPNSDRIRLAVLPFINMSEDPSQEYFADGMTEEIIAQLAIVDMLSVISRRSVDKYKNIDTDVPTIAKELGVKYILEGSVRKQADKIRITTKLINTETDENIWIQHFNKALAEILDVQVEVAKEVASILNIKLSLPEVSRIERKSTIDFTAYDYYLKAVHEDRKWTEEGMNNAIAYLERAIELDPNFSEAYSLLAWEYVNLVSMFSAISHDEALMKALPAVKKAVALDSLSSDAFLVYGSVKFYLEWNFTEAQRFFERSMELNSWGESPIHQCLCSYVEFLMLNDKLTETWELLDRIKIIDPSFVMVFEYESYLHLLQGEKELALEAFEKRLPYSDTLDWYFHYSYGSILYYADRFEGAIERLEKSLLLNNDNNFSLHYLGLAYAKTGNKTKAKEFLQKLIEKNKSKAGKVNSMIASIYHELGDYDKAFDHLQMAYDNRESLFIWVFKMHFEKMINDSRYKALSEKLQNIR